MTTFRLVQIHASATNPPTNLRPIVILQQFALLNDTVTASVILILLIFSLFQFPFSAHRLLTETQPLTHLQTLPCAARRRTPRRLLRVLFTLIIIKSVLATEGRMRNWRGRFDTETDEAFPVFTVLHGNFFMT